MADHKKHGDKRRGSTEIAAVAPPAPHSARWENEEVSPKTVRMTSQTMPPPVKPVRGVEMFVIDEAQMPGAERRPWRAAEIWTKRRVYGLDSTWKCIEILDRETGRPEPAHEMLGARLGGGRSREKDTVKFSYPLPLPGMEAMFMKGKKHGYTSIVERMIVRIRVLHTNADDTMPSWDEIASRWSEVPPKM